MQLRMLHVFIICCLGVAAYSNTLHSPFQWDELSFIASNPIIKNVSYFLHPGDAASLPYYDAVRARYVSYLTFALNYRVHGMQVTGYHVVNLAIHLCAALALYVFAFSIFQAPALRTSVLARVARPAALFASGLFVAHPVQTEAVTYVFQRHASLAGMLCLASAAAYASYRQASGPGRRMALYLLALASCAMAMKAKESAFTFPLVIALYEFVFFNGPVRPRLARLAPLLATMVIVPLTVLTSPGAIHESSAWMGEPIAPLTYFITQLRVLATYLRLMVLPVGQNLYYDFKPLTSFGSPEVLASAVLILGLGALGVAALWAGKRADGRRWLLPVGVGVLWFFLTISVESSFMVIPRIIAEYRLYLPSAGLCIAVSAAMSALAARAPHDAWRMAAAALSVTVVLALAGAAYARNEVWRTEVGLWSDVVAKSPRLVWARVNLGARYRKAGMPEAAMREYAEAIRLDPGHPVPYNNMGNIHLSRGEYDQAIGLYLKALWIKPDYADAYVNLAIAYERTGADRKAEESYLAALGINPYDPDAHRRLGGLYERHGQHDMARPHLDRAQTLSPTH